MIPCDLWILRVCCLHLLLSQWSQRGDFYLTFSTPHPLLSPTLSFTSLLILVSICATIVVFAYPVFSRICFRASDSVLWPAVTTLAGSGGGLQAFNASSQLFSLLHHCHPQTRYGSSNIAESIQLQLLTISKNSNHVSL